jgi:post-segregation antitoxin (ccd killing protein)
MATIKISVTVDAEVLSRIRQFLPENTNLSGIINEALHEQLARHEALAVLDEMERERPISEAGKVAGERLWQAIESSSTRAPLPRSQPVKKRSGSRSQRH